MPEWNEETQEQFSRALTAFKRGASFGPREDRERHAKSADALAAALEEIERLQNSVTTQKVERVKLTRRIKELEALLWEWLHTPYFETEGEWDEWVTEFRPRVQKLLEGEGK